MQGGVVGRERYRSCTWTVKHGRSYKAVDRIWHDLLQTIAEQSDFSGFVSCDLIESGMLLGSRYSCLEKCPHYHFLSDDDTYRD